MSTDQIKTLETQLQSLYRAKEIENHSDRLDRAAIRTIDLKISQIEDMLNLIDPDRIAQIEKARINQIDCFEKDKTNELLKIEHEKEIRDNLKNAFQVAILFPARLSFKAEYEAKIIKLVQNKAPYVQFSIVCSKKNDYHGFFHFEDLYHKYPDVGSNGFAANNYKAKRFISDYKGWWAETSKMLSEIKPDAVIVIADPDNEQDKPFLQFVMNVLKKYHITTVKYITL